MTYTKDNLRQLFQQPFNMSEWKQMLHHYFQATELRAEPERIEGTTEDEQGYYLGAIDTTDSYRIGLFYYQIQHGNVARKRVGLRNLVKSFVNPNWGEFDAALVVFDSNESVWRLSFICDIKGESTAPKRYTYVFGEVDNYYNTPVGRFDALQRKGISFENIKDAFSVEALSKEFFDEYREHYADIVEYITGKRYVKEKGKWVEKTIHEPCHEIFNQFVAVYKDPEKTVRDYIKKLMGRLVFLQFLQKKEWMGVPADRQDWKGGDTRFLQNKFNEFADKDNFIDGFLEPLFNDLNTNRQNNNDLASPKVGSDIKIPFLNGGLFQLDEEDCSNIRLPQHLLGDVLDFFERYNFTIDENDPNDAQIGVDPEMLGRVFENLLEDNKDKGAFYTPKEIVQYMCQESLIAYLQTGIDDEADKESIRQFVLTHEAEHLGSMAEDISIKLLNVKICDPAIGSGAFPMGLLRQLYLCQCAIHPELEEKNAADIKRHIIQNNIYGVDIEKGAVDIARLRFWLSLIVDEETPRFLPNLDFKIMQGNSLLEQYKGVDLSKMTTLSTEQGKGTQLTWFDKELDILRFDLREKLNEYYNCSDHQRKEQLKQEIIDNVKQQLREQSINVDFGDLDLSANDQFTLWHTWFYDVFSQGGFDIVIGNPPYKILTKNNTNVCLLKHYIEDFVSLKKASSKNLYTLFIEKAVIDISERANAVVSYIIPEGLFKTRSYKDCVDIMNSYGCTKQIVTFSDYVFENAVTGSLIFVYTKGKEISPMKCFSYKGDNVFEYYENEEESILDKIASEGKSLSELAVLFKGMVIKDRDIVLHKEKNDLPNKFILGKNISKWNVESFYYTDYSQLEIIGGTKRLEKHQTFPRIVIRRTGNELCCALLKYPCITESTLYSCWPKDNTLNIYYLYGLLNSRLLNYYNIRKNITNQQGFPQILMTDLQEIPIKVGSKEQIKTISEIASQISSSGDDEMKLDLLVYHLYGLTYDEVLIVDPETPITREEYEKQTEL